MLRSSPPPADSVVMETKMPLQTPLSIIQPIRKTKEVQPTAAPESTPSPGRRNSGTSLCGMPESLSRVAPPGSSRLLSRLTGSQDQPSSLLKMTDGGAIGSPIPDPGAPGWCCRTDCRRIGAALGITARS